MGRLTEDQIFTWLAKKDGRNFTGGLKSKLKSSINELLSTSGLTTAGGGNTRYTFNGDPTYHLSNGAGFAEGVTIFFVKRPGDTAKVIAMGYHVGAQTYDLTWVHHDWSAIRNVKRISLDK